MRPCPLAPPLPVSDNTLVGDALATSAGGAANVRRVASLALAAPAEGMIGEDDTLCLNLTVHVSAEGELSVDCVARPAERGETQPAGMFGRVLGALNLTGTSDSANDRKAPQMLGSCRAAPCAIPA
jgi:hypothetical protein